MIRRTEQDGESGCNDVGVLPAVVQQAAELARACHGEQTDKAGRPYFQVHVLDVYRRVAGASPSVQAVALLHDVLEDTSCDERRLRAMFPARVVDAVVALTHRPREPLLAYYERVRADPVALTVKLADIASNTDPERTALLDPATRARLADKYRAALIALSATDSTDSSDARGSGAAPASGAPDDGGAVPSGSGARDRRDRGSELSP